MTSFDAPLPLLVQTCLRQPTPRPPVWLMRQAGRYMAEYQAVRAKSDFITMCKTQTLAFEVSLQPYRAFGMDAVILFSDILFPAEAMGLPLDFQDGVGPILGNAVRSAADVDRLSIPDPELATGFVMDTLRQLRAELKDDLQTALIGFGGAPWTLASYMIEGGTSKQYRYIKGLMYDDPALLHRLLAKITQTVIVYLNAQIAAGAQVIQLFDSWAGILTPAQYREFALPYHQQVFENLSATGPDGARVPKILYVNGSHLHVAAMAQSGADVISIDHQTDLLETVATYGDRLAVQGNLDPVLLFAQPAVLQTHLDDMLASARRQSGGVGYLVNLGHGVLPGTPVENVRCFVDTVKRSAHATALA
jgi:uroporphyrinogen decarboxylase